jgi:glycosyltransferase involved in cell wall biosynthesis
MKRKENDINNRKYDYGLIVSNFNRPIKNVNGSIKYLMEKIKEGKKVILIGKNSNKYNGIGFDTVDLVDNEDMIKYYNEIKCIVQDSHYESCSNVMVEGLFNGCIIKYNIIISSTQYPGYGGAATNAYQLIKYLRSIGNNVCGVFFHNDRNVNYNPDELEGIFLFREPNKIINRVCCEYLDGRPDFCMAKNYLAPIYCKKIFNCHTIYLVSGINHFNMFYPQISAQMMLNPNFIIDKRIKEELFCNHLSDEIIVNSKLTKKLFKKIYPMFKDKITSVVDTSFLNNKINIKPKKEKEYDILVCASNWKRPVKNTLFLVKLFSDKRMNKYKKVVIGEKYQPFAFFPNITCKGLLERKECLETINNCKVILCPSLFDSNPAVLAEAKKLGCDAILTKNVGSYKIYGEDSICNSFIIEEWLNKIENKIK